MLGKILGRQNLPSPSPTQRRLPKDYTAKFIRTDDLATRIAHMDYFDPKQVQAMNQIRTCDLLVLDDFLTTPISEATADDLFNILAGREGLGSTMVTSQFTPQEWYMSMPDKVVAESMMNRLVGGAKVINLAARTRHDLIQPTKTALDWAPLHNAHSSASRSSPSRFKMHVLSTLEIAIT